MKKIYNESDIRNDYKKLTKLLIERGMTITTMESATSGQIASLITNADPANLEVSVPGQVYFAIELNGEVMSYYLELQPQPTRLAYKLAVAKEIYDALMERL